MTRFSLVSKVPKGLTAFVLKRFIRVLQNEMIPLEILDTNGRRLAVTDENPRYKLLVRDRKVFFALAFPNAFSLGDAYVKGYFDIRGSIMELYEAVWRRLLHTDQSKSVFKSISDLFVRKRVREKNNIEYHYDVPAGFYRLFLGRTMGYTCGYYPSRQATMSEAQEEKMDIVCRKLRLAPGERLLDIGCGWGSFIVHAARHYGVNATGITLSGEQKDYGDRWIRQEGLEDRVSIHIMNYRDLGNEKFDKISCVGMSEHVGRANMKLFYRIVHECLVSDGLFLQHTITTNRLLKKGYRNSFLDRYMFPGGELMLQKDLIHLASKAGFELLNADNLRLHYVRTLKDWIRRMEARKEDMLQHVSDRVFRIYHLFFIGALVSFRQNEIALFQNLFYKHKIPDAKISYFTTPYSKNDARTF